MIFSSRLSLSNLIELCRVLRHYLGAGLTLRDAFRQQAARGDLGLRPTAGRIAAELNEGGALEDALKREGDAFPPLLTALACVGEQTGMLPEVFTELEKYYVRQQQLRRSFWSRATWPILQFFGAVFVLAGLIFIMGLLPQPSGQFALHYDPVGLGLSGPEGALIFLAWVFGILLFFAVLYFAAKRLLRAGAFVDGFLLRVPILGRCLRALALTRFCLALRLTLETGMPIARALRLSFRATGNAAFAEGRGKAVASVKEGEELTTALTATGLFPEEFRHVLFVGEESGRLTEVLRQEAEHYHEEADRRMKALTTAMTVVVWLIVAGFIIAFVFHIFSQYLDLFNQVG
jgi:type IV pilus assembly protein PilC